MKLVKLIATIGLSLLSLQCFAETLVTKTEVTILCSKPQPTVAAAREDLDAQLFPFYEHASAPEIVQEGGQYTMCVTVEFHNFHSNP